MELNRLLLWMAGVSCSLNLLYVLRSSGRPQRGWRGILTGLLVTGVIGVLTIPNQAGYLVGGGWFLLVLLPGLMQRLANRLLVKRRYGLAMWCARVSSWLHPFDAWPDHPEVIRALQWLHEGRTAEAKALFARLGRLGTGMGRMAMIVEGQQTGDWANLLEWLEWSHSPGTLIEDEHLLMMQLQALGELGRRQEMLTAYQRFLDGQQAAGNVSTSMLQIRVAALCGLVPTTDLLADTLSVSLPDDSQQFWRLTARQVAGTEGTADAFRALESSASPYLRPMIAGRLSSPLTAFGVDELDERASHTREALVRSVAHETRYAVMHSGSRRRPYATWAIAAVLIGSFIREIPGGSTDSQNLFELGALLIPTSLTPGEWWRMITAGLLHFGPLHLAMNLLGLLYLGSRLERAWGFLRMMACYAIATVTSMGLAPYLVTLNDEQPIAILVGASGGVMGLVGALIGHLTVGWWHRRNPNISRQLGTLLLLVGLQTFFDLTTPNVSFACHLLGLLTGLTFAIVLSLWDALWRTSLSR